MQLIDWLMVFGYFGVLAVVVSVTLRKRKIRSGEDLFLGGRSVGWLAIGASLFAANIGSEHLVGLAGAGASAGLSQAHWEFNSWIIVGMAWIFLPFYYKSGVSTMPEFIGRRFGERARWLLTLVSLAAYVLTKIAVTVFAGAVFFQTMMPELQLVVGDVTITSFWLGAVLTVVLAGIYSSVGGLSAVVYTDVVQTVVILVGTLSVTGFSLYYLGHSGVVLPDGQVAQSMSDGWQVLKQTIVSSGAAERFSLFHSLTHPTFPWLGVMVASLVSGCWYWCTDQFIVQRTLAAKDLTNARRGVLFGSLLRFTPVFLFIVPGMLGFALWQNHVSIGGVEFGRQMTMLVDGVRSIDGDKVFPTLVQSVLPVGFRGIVVAGMVAALMSSMASLFNSVSTLFTMDVFLKLRPDAGQKTVVLVGRCTTVVMTCLGLLWLPVVKLISSGGLYEYLQNVQSFLAPPIVAVFLAGLFWKRANLAGSITGLAGGFALGIGKLVLKAVCSNADGWIGAVARFNDYYFSGVLFVLSVIFVAAASLATQAPDASRLGGLNYFCLDEVFRKENRASWNWVDVAVSAGVVSLVVAAYVYFYNWLGGTP